MTSRYVSSCHADLLQPIAIGSDKRVVGLAAKDIDCPARNILFVAFVGKQRASGWLCDAPPSLIFIECPLQRAERSEEHTSELQSLMRISYAVFCLKKKKTI